MMAAQDAMLASTQDPAATLTVRQYSAAGAPVAGSIRWWRVRPPRTHRRTEVLEVASPPDRIETTGPPPSGGSAWSWANPDDPALLRRRPGHGHVTPEAYQHPGPGGGGDGPGGPVGAQRLGRGPQVQDHARRHLHGGGRPVHPHPLPARDGL